jgi:hypothetical protein
VWAAFLSIDWQNKACHWSFESLHPCKKFYILLFASAFWKPETGKVEGSPQYLNECQGRDGRTSEKHRRH